MRIIGIVGGIASGKTTVARLLEACGAGILDGDRTGHEVLAEEEVKTAIRQRWGEDVFTPAGEIDRARVAQIVFTPDPDRSPELEFLEQLTHPRIRSRLKQRVDDLSDAGKKAAVLDAPLLLEAGWNKLCDVILFIVVPRETRLAWAANRGWTEIDFARREAIQQPLDQKRAHADWIIDNSGSLDSTRKQVLEFWNQVVEKPQSQ